MKPKDITKIESALNLKVPASYSTVVLEYPCAASEDICCHGLFSDPNRVIDVNQEHRKDGWFGLDWPDHFLVIGDDGCGNTYFMVIGKDEKVYMADHEGGPSYETELDDCVHFDSIQEHIEEELGQEREFQEDERKRKNKKWWQFWA